jgi:hypothetical protein
VDRSRLCSGRQPAQPANSVTPMPQKRRGSCCSNVTPSTHSLTRDVCEIAPPNAQPLRPLEIVARDSLLPRGRHGSARTNPQVSMRACARVALAIMAVSASISLAACGAIDDLRDAMSQWFDVGKSPGRAGGLFADHLPNTTPMKKSLKSEASKASKTSKKKDKPAGKVQRPRTVERKLPTSHTVDAPKPQAAEPQSLPTQLAPSGLRGLYPEPPPAGTFSR